MQWQMKILMLGNDDFSIWHFRRGLIKALVAEGHEIVVATPDGEYVDRLVDLGTRHIPVSIYRFMSPLRDLVLFWRILCLFRAERPDLVHTMTIKPNVYGAIAAKLAGVRRVVSLVPGLGYCFQDAEQRRPSPLQRVVTLLYRISGRLIYRMWFQNRDDRKLFIDAGIVTPEQAVLIPGSGVNLDEYNARRADPTRVAELRSELGLQDNDIVVLMMVARVIWCKGVKEFIAASQMAATWKRRVVFVLVGPTADDSPDLVDADYLKDQTSANFRWLGFQSDVREIISLADVVTLPSFYREGIPRVLLEAMALEKPIVTTDNVGCREVVEDGKNGYLIPVRDTQALASAIQKLTHDDILRAACGRQSRIKAENEFDEKVVVSRVMEDLYGLERTNAQLKAA